MTDHPQNKNVIRHFSIRDGSEGEHGVADNWFSRRYAMSSITQDPRWTFLSYPYPAVYVPALGDISCSRSAVSYSDWRTSIFDCPIISLPIMGREGMVII